MKRLPRLGRMELGTLRRRPRLKGRQSRKNMPSLEDLERRTVLSMIDWALTTGGSWDDPNNWVGGVAPGPQDTAVIKDLTGSNTAVYLSSGNADQVGNVVTDSSVTLEILNGSLTLGTASNSTLGGQLIVASQAAFNVGTGSSLTLSGNQPLTVNQNGNVTFNNADTVTFATAGSETTQIEDYGTLTATGTSFVNSGSAGGSTTQVYVESGGQLNAASSTFNIDQLYFNNGSVLSSGDLTDDTFNLPIYVPAPDASLLAGNVSFENIDILGGAIDQSAALNVLGTGTEPDFEYIFNSGLEVESGASLTIASDVKVMIATDETITVDSGASMTVGAATIEINNYDGGTYGLNVAGSLTLTGTSFTTYYTVGSQGDGDSVTIESGGQVIATGSTFSWDSFSLENGSILSAGNLSGDIFGDTTVYAPGNDIPLLAGSNLEENVSFGNVDIIGGTLSTGTVNLGLMGSGSTASLRYVFPSGYTVDSGASLTIANGVSVLLDSTETITIDSGATMTTGSATIEVNNYYGGTYGLSVAGTLTATGTSFTAYYTVGSQGDGDSLTVVSGGHLMATDSTFAWDSVSLNNGSIFNAGDLSGDTFSGTTLSVPGSDIPLLAGPNLTENVSFANVDIIAGSLSTGTVNLGLMGSGSTASLRYVFPSGYTVDSGASLTVANGVSVLIDSSETITIESDASMTTGTATIEVNNYYGGTYGLSLAGTLTATGTSFTTTYTVGSQGDGDSLTVVSGGHLIASDSTFAWDSLSLQNGSIFNAGDLAGDTFSGTTLSVPGSDIPLLAGPNLTENVSFANVDINAGSLSSGAVNLGLMGSGSTAALRYVFPSGFTIDSGASLTVANGVSVLIDSSETITIDSGATMTTGSATIEVNNYYGGTYGLSVAGTLTATGTSFTTYYTVGSQGDGDSLTVVSGGHLIASDSTFAWDSLSLQNGSIFNAGDLSGSTFSGTTLYVPGSDIPLLAGSNLTENVSFGNVDIISGSLTSGTVNLGLMGSGSTASLRYVFESGYTVESGASLSVANNVSVLIDSSATITIESGATMTTGSATIEVDNYYGGTYGLSVAGTLTATGTSFTTEYTVGSRETATP